MAENHADTDRIAENRQAFADEAVAARVRGVLVRLSGLGLEWMLPEARLKEDLELDSLDRITAAMAIEDEFKIDLTDDEVANARMATVGGLIAYLIAEKGVGA